MSIPFARSERALQTDDYRTALICGLITIPLFVAWLAWFFASDLPVRQVSQQLTAGDFDTLIANFAWDGPPKLQIGDAASLQVKLPDGEGFTTIAAVVADIRQRRDGTYDVYLYPATEEFPDGIRSVSSLATLVGYAEVDVDSRSPFDYLMQLGLEQ